MKKIGILGGTFDPIHKGHTELARKALEEYGLDSVLVMTGGNPPHKRDKKVSDVQLRHEMVKLALKNEKSLIPFDFEVNKKEYSYTANTLTELKRLYKDWEIYFIIGEDSLRDFDKWYKPETITSNCILLVYPRDNNSDLHLLIEKQRNEFNADIRPISANIIDISSTDIRNRIKESASVEGLVDCAVLDFIKEKGLYK